MPEPPSYILVKSDRQGMRYMCPRCTLAHQNTLKWSGKDTVPKVLPCILKVGLLQRFAGPTLSRPLKTNMRGAVQRCTQGIGTRLCAVAVLSIVAFGSADTRPHTLSCCCDPHQAIEAELTSMEAPTGELSFSEGDAFADGDHPDPGPSPPGVLGSPS